MTKPTSVEGESMNENTTTAQSLTCINAERITRVTLVDREKGIIYEQYGVGVDVSVQDDGQTLKLFLKDLPPARQQEMRRQVDKGWRDFFEAGKNFFRSWRHP